MRAQEAFQREKTCANIAKAPMRAYAFDRHKIFGAKALDVIPRRIHIAGRCDARFTKMIISDGIYVISKIESKLINQNHAR
jgi:hypothetical protein